MAIELGHLDPATHLKLWTASHIVLYSCLPGLVWVLYDWLLTLGEEVEYIWTQKRGPAKIMFLWIRYYTIALLIFDITQIHLFARPGITNDNVCVAMDSVIRVVGAISLWSVEIIMQLRIYALYGCSRKVAIINAFAFLGSIAGFFYVLIFNAIRRRAVIAEAIQYPLPGCPSVHTGIEWLQWIPATLYEGLLFFWAVYKAIESAAQLKQDTKRSLLSLILFDNLIYFFGVSVVLIFNNLMVVGVTKIPWFSYSPFHATLGILTCRMLLNVRKAAVKGTSTPNHVSTTRASLELRTLSFRAARNHDEESMIMLATSPATFKDRGSGT